MRTECYIGGFWTKGAGDAREVVDPTQGTPFAVVHDASTAQVDAAVDAGRPRLGPNDDRRTRGDHAAGGGRHTR